MWIEIFLSKILTQQNTAILDLERCEIALWQKKKGIKKEAKIKIIFKNTKQIKTKQKNHKQPNKKNTERIYTNRIQ